jgi:type III restriction enzyme
MLNDELEQNFRMTIEDLKQKSKPEKRKFKVRFNKPPRYIKLKYIRHNYKLEEKEYSDSINFGLNSIDNSKYASTVFIKDGLTSNSGIKEENIDEIQENVKYSMLTLVGEISRYMNIEAKLISKILRESEDGESFVLEKVNQYNDILYDIIVPKIFNTLYEVKSETESLERDVLLLKEPKDSGYYEFSSNPEMVVKESDNDVEKYKSKSFHADTYCFDSNPEKRFFYQYLKSNKVKNIYFTGMFTSNQSDFYIQYIDPDTNRLRRYYPDFIAKMEDGSYQIIEVKGDNKIDDIVVKAKKDAAMEVAAESSMEYKIFAGSTIMKKNVIDN